jgi:exodeoxyribonuclease VII large subunit
MSLVVVDVRVQGIGAAHEVARGIAQLNEHPEIEVIIVARGGGSLEDLWAFNEEEVVRAVFASRKPIVSAIGHEVDVTLCDYAADVRAPTPTAAAELVAPDGNELLRSLLNHERRLAVADRWMRDRCRTVDDAEMAIQAGLRRRFDTARNQIAVMQSLVQSLEPTRRLSHSRGLLDQIAARHHQGIATRIKQEQLKLDRLEGMRGATSPERVLERGYAIVRGSKGVIDRTSAVPEDGSFQLHFRDGKVLVERYRDQEHLTAAAN